MSSVYFLGIAIVLLITELFYFRIARRYAILDRPNNRSMHEKPTIRGGGVVFFVSVLVYYLIAQKPSWLLMVAVTLVAVIGFMDDLKGMGRLLRFGIQSLAFLIIFYDIGLYAQPIWVILIVFIVSTGTINAYNFMDGINGITGGYSLVALATLYFINAAVISFTDSNFLIVVMVGLLIFNFFNFRTKAVCFAGDVGSLTIGFIVIYLILQLIMTSHNYIFVLLLAVYGTDSVLTILHRLRLRENIFKPHRLHLYQVVISKNRMPHVLMTAIYMIAQLAVNAILIYNLQFTYHEQAIVGFALLVTLASIYWLIKSRFMPKAS